MVKEECLDVSSCDEATQKERLESLFSELRNHSCAGMKYFEDSEGPINRSFYSSYQQLLGHLVGGIESGVSQLISIASHFDYDPVLVRGNGYRSIISAVQRCCENILALCKEIKLNRESYLFNSGHYSRELEAYVTTLGQLRACVYYLRRLASYCRQGHLHADESTLSTDQYSVAEKLMTEVETLCQESFYGRCLAFQFCSSMKRPLEVVNVAMASYGEAYSTSTSPPVRLATGLASSLKYIVSPELRAKQVVNLTRNNDVQFCKSFWALQENILLHKLPLYMCPRTAVDRVIQITPHPPRTHPSLMQPLQLPLTADSSRTTDIPPACRCDGQAVYAGTRICQPINVRLISTVIREGQAESRRYFAGKVEKRSPCLLVHFHGGGFVAQSSASHEVYLRHWAADLNVPVFSIDYSLAPEKQFPYPHDEAFYAYCWAIKNAESLGSTAERVVVAGDSAGGNLAVAVAMRAASCGMRVPDGIMSVYGCLLVKYTPSPSRILALMDPLVPLGALSMCLGAYAGLKPDDESVSPRSRHPSVSDPTPPTPLLTASTVEEPTPFGPYTHHGSALDATSPTTSRKHHNSGDSGICESSPSSHAIGPRVDQSRADISTAEEGGNSENVTTPSVMGIPLWKRRLMDDGSLSAMPKCASLPSCCEMARTPFSPGTQPRVAAVNPSMRQDSMRQDSMRQDTIEEDLPRVDRCFHDVAKFANLKHFAQSPIEQSKRVRVAENPYLSPLLASDDLLTGLPPVHLISCHLDPMLDDSIMFAKRLRAVRSSITLELLPDLPHGFLNFSLVSAEASKGSARCVEALRKLLRLPSAGPAQADGPTQAPGCHGYENVPKEMSPQRVGSALRAVTPVASSAGH